MLGRADGVGEGVRDKAGRHRRFIAVTLEDVWRGNASGLFHRLRLNNSSGCDREIRSWTCDLQCKPLK